MKCILPILRYTCNRYLFECQLKTESFWTILNSNSKTWHGRNFSGYSHAFVSRVLWSFEALLCSKNLPIRICSDWKQPFSDKSKKILTYTMFAIYEMPFSMLYLIYMQSIFWPIVRNSTFRCRIRKKLQKMRQEYELLTSYSICM